MGTLTSTLSVDHVTQSEADRAEGSRASRPSARPIDVSQLDGRDLDQRAMASLVYKPSQARRRANLAQFVAKTRAVDPAGADRMAATFASNDIIAMADGLMRKVGLRADNVADAYAVYWTNAWLGSRGRNEDLPADQMKAISRQAAAALTSTPEFAGATDSTKQELAEAMLVQAIMISGAVDMGKGDPKLMSETKRAISQGARAMGLDLSSMTLMAEGFRPVKGGDAEPASGGADSVALSAATQSPSSAGTSVAGALLAGGAGLGAAFLLGKAMARRG